VEPDLVGHVSFEGRAAERRRENERSFFSIAASSALGRTRLQRRRHRGRQTVPAVGFLAEALPSRRGEAVVLRAPVVLGRAPLGVEQALVLETVERGVERALLDEERALGDLLDPRQDGVAVQGPSETDLRMRTSRVPGRRAACSVMRVSPNYVRYVPTVLLSCQGETRNRQLIRVSPCPARRRAQRDGTEDALPGLSAS
jgi:hypothetical protein